MSDHDYNVDDIELKIDTCRLKDDWRGVMRGLEIYTHIFDSGEPIEKSKQHPDINCVRAYYWVCMAEAQLEIKLDFMNALDCCRRALEIEVHYIDAKIVMCKILLELGNSLLTENNFGGSSRRKARAMTQNAEYPEICSTKSLSAALTSFPEQDQRLFVEAVQSLPPAQKSGLLAVLNSLSAPEIIAVCDDTIFHVRQQISATSLNRSFPIRWIYFTCLHLLKHVSLEDMIWNIEQETISEYRTWLSVDAICARGVIREWLGCVQESKRDFIYLLEHCIPHVTGWEPSGHTPRAPATPGSPVSVGSRVSNSRLSKLPTRTVISVAVRHALAEVNTGTVSDAFQAISNFVHFINLGDYLPLLNGSNSGNDSGASGGGIGGSSSSAAAATTVPSIWVPEFASTLSQRYYLGLFAEAALLLIHREKSIKSANQARRKLRLEVLGSTSTNRSRESFLGTLTPQLAGQNVHHFDDAGMFEEQDSKLLAALWDLLQFVKASSSRVASAEEASASVAGAARSAAAAAATPTAPPTESATEVFSSFLEPERRSLLSFLPTVNSDPCFFNHAGSGSVLGALQAGVLRRRDGDAASTQQQVSLLEWGLLQDTVVDVDALMVMAKAYEENGNYPEALEILNQCYAECKMRSREQQQQEQQQQQQEQKGSTALGDSSDPKDPRDRRATQAPSEPHTHSGPRQHSPAMHRALYEWLDECWPSSDSPPASSPSLGKSSQRQTRILNGTQVRAGGVAAAAAASSLSLASEDLAVPLLAAARLSLRCRNDPRSAVAYLHKGLEEVYPEIGASLLESLGSYSSMSESSSRRDASANTNVTTAAIDTTKSSRGKFGRGNAQTEQVQAVAGSARGLPFHPLCSLRRLFSTGQLSSGPRLAPGCVLDDSLDDSLRAMIEELAAAHVAMASAASGPLSGPLSVTMSDWDKAQHLTVAVKAIRLLMEYFSSMGSDEGDDFSAETQQAASLHAEESRQRPSSEAKTAVGDQFSSAVGSVRQKRSAGNLHGGDEEVDGIEGCSELVALHYAVALAELGEVSTSLRVTRRCLAVDMYPHSIPLTHLLALLLSCSSSASPSATATAAAVCERACTASENNTNVRVTMALLEWSAGEKETALSFMDGVMERIAQQEALFDEVADEERLVRALTARTLASTRQQQQQQQQQQQPVSVASPTSAVATPTLSHDHFATPPRPQRPSPPLSIELGSLSSSPPVDPAEDGKKPRRITSVKARRVERKLSDARFIFHTTDILVQAAKMYRLAGDVARAKQCLLQAWQNLFTCKDRDLQAELTGGATSPFSSATAFHGTSTSQRAGKGQTGFGDSLDIDAADAQAGRRLPRHQPTGASVERVQENRRVELLRHVPTMMGWRLSSACGWAAPVSPAAQAQVLTEGAALLQVEHRDLLVPVAIELLETALAISPCSFSTLVALAQVELARARVVADRQAALSFVPHSRVRADISKNEWGHGYSSNSKGQLFTRILNFGSDSAENRTGSSSSRRSSNSGAYRTEGRTSYRSLGSVNRSSASVNAQIPATGRSSSQAAAKSQAQTKHEQAAHDYSLAAVRARELSSEAWDVYGLSLSLTGTPEDATAATIKSLECRMYTSIRPFSCVLMDDG